MYKNSCLSLLLAARDIVKERHLRLCDKEFDTDDLKSVLNFSCLQVTDKRPQRSNVHAMNLYSKTVNIGGIKLILLQKMCVSFAGACLHRNKKLYHNQPVKKQNQTILKLHDYLSM